MQAALAKGTIAPELFGRGHPPGPQEAMEQSTFLGRPYLRIMFDCCRVYQRIYRDRTGKYYEGRCPRCMRAVRFKIAPHGTSTRAFSVR